MERRAADRVHHRVARRADRLAEDPLRRNLVLRLLHRLRPVADVVAQLVGREVVLRQPRARFKGNHLEAGLRDGQRGDASSGAQADDDDFGVFKPGRHGHPRDLHHGGARWPC